MKLFNLSDGRVSLEFAHSEWADVQAGLAKVAGRQRYKVREEATHDMIDIGGEQLILMDEWEEPCLISMSEQGDHLLRSLEHIAVKGTIQLQKTSNKSDAALAA